jgi:hypothetical protein
VANLNFKVKNGLEVGTGVTISSGIISATSIVVSGNSASTFSQLNVSGVSTFQSNVHLGDNDRIIFGDGNDLQIWHSGSDSVIADLGTGNLALLGDNEVWIGNTAASEYRGRFINNGAVELYYDNSKEFETTGYGATVFGILQSQGLQVSGVSTTSTLNVGTGGTVITTTGIGSVGIGTISPIEKLTVYGTGIVRTLVQNPGTTGNDFAVYDWKAGSTNHWSAYVNASTNYFRIFDNSKGANGLRFIIDDDGDVGLGGTVTPSAKLDVTGNVKISSNLSVTGISTFSPTGIGTVVIGVGTTALLVQGNARITGILTIGQSSLTLDGNNNQILVGAGVTIYGNTGIISATEFRGNGANLTGVQPFPSGTLMLFQQTAAPTGWTKQTTHNDKTLRVVSGNASSGGTTAFTSVFASRTPSGSVSGSNSGGSVANTTLSTTQIPSHDHTLSLTEADDNNHSGNGNNSAANADAGINGSCTVSATGGSGAHNHSFTNPSWSGSFTGSSMDFNVQYVDLIIASKD